MADSFEMQIVKLEEKLRLAMLQSDVSALDELLADELIFTSHTGQLFTKQDDLNAHKSGIVKIESIRPIEQQIKVLGNIAIVSLRVQIAGSIAGNFSDCAFRFTRVWVKEQDESWHVIAAHSSILE